MSMSTQDSGGRWLRPGAAAAIAAAGVLIPAGYAAVTYEASHGPFGYLAGVFVFMLLVVCLAIAGALGAALVALGKPVDVAGTVQLFVICAVPLLVGYGIGRGLARLG
jgi:hypothetical protein